MSKYLVNPIGSVWKNPLSVYDLKRDLLLYDKLAMLNIHELLQGLHEYKQYEIFRNTLNEIEYLLEKGLCVELISLMMPMAQKGSALINVDDLGLADLTMQLKTQMLEAKTHEERDKLYFKHDELNTRLMSNIINDNNESVYTIPSLLNFGSFEMSGTSKQKAFSILHKMIPLPSNNTPWEKIIDFKNDSESQLKLLALKNWINELPDNIKVNELEDKIKYLSHQHSESLKKHKINSQLISFKTIVNTIPTAVSELIRLRIDKAVAAFFAIAEQEVNFTKQREKEELPGKELAYLSLVKSKFANK